MVRLAAGELAALGALATRHEQDLRRLAYRLLQDWQAAEDVAQDTLLRLLESAGRYRPGQSFRGWLLRIAVNRCRDLLRRRRWSRQLGPHELRAPVADTDADERAAAVRSAVAALPTRQRVALVLHRFSELSIVEVAGITGWSASAVESLLVRAYRRLRQALQHDPQPQSGVSRQAEDRHGRVRE